jgi:hypothetical protein
MAISYVGGSGGFATGNARLAATLTTVVSGQTVDGAASFGQLVIGTASLSGGTGVLATITLQKPSFSIASKTATLLGVPLSAVASATGTAALAELRDSTGLSIVTGLTVATSGANINLGTVSITSGQTVTITSGSIASP